MGFGKIFTGGIAHNKFYFQKTFLFITLFKLQLDFNLCWRLLKFAFSVHNLLGPGLLESAYEGALCVELALAGLSFEQQKVFPLYYKGQYIGEYIADLVVNDRIIVELKSVSKLTPVMETQIIHYLKLSKLKVGYLVNFNSVSLVWKRFVNQ